MKGESVGRSDDAISACAGPRGVLPAVGLCLLVALMTLLWGCADVGEVTSTPITDAPTQSPAADPEQAASPEPTHTLVGPQSPISLTVWVPEEYSPEGPGGEVWAQALTAFAELPNGAPVTCRPKKPYGIGGISNLLATTGLVNPGRLPDLVIVDASEIASAAVKGLLQPLSGEFSQEILGDMYAFAVEAGRHDGELCAIPFAADICFAAYDTDDLREAPISWAGIMTDGIRYAFPAGPGGCAAGDALLLQCMALGDSAWKPEGSTLLRQRDLSQALGFYWEGMRRGSIPAAVLGASSLEETWAMLKGGEANLVHVDSRQYTQQRKDHPSLRYASIPTAQGRPATLARSWAWCVTTDEPHRRQSAIALIAWLMSTETLGQWSSISGHLPTRRSALSVAVEDAAYEAFLRQQLDNARCYPLASEADALSDGLGAAARDVLRGSATPEEAALVVARAMR